jgi:hypothetical protein
MKSIIRIFWILILSLMTILTYGQDPAPTAFVMQIDDNNNLQLGQVALPGASIYATWNPQSNNSLARVDDYGLLRFAPIGSAEGVYSFSPYFSGFSTPSLEDNEIAVSEVEWSPNGQQVAFRLSTGASAGSDGVWFWQPAQVTATDPSYHLLRDCPPGCGLANSRDTDKWKSLSVDWSPDNVAILVHLYLPDEERNALGLVFASRDPESPQADIQPPTYRYEYGSWANDGNRLVVSGYNPDSVAVYGFMERDGSNTQINLASDIGLAYVRNTIHHPITGQLIMLGSPANDTAPIAIYDNNGTQLTPQIGDQAPDFVEWSPNRNAVFVRAGGQAFIATINGELYNITETVGDNPMVVWTQSGFPGGVTSVNLPPALAIQPEATPILITIPAENVSSSDNSAQTIDTPQSDFAPGQLLQVVDNLTLYAEPTVGAEKIANLEQGEALVLIGGPLTDGRTVWWRIQTLNHVGWAEETVNGVAQFSS